MKQIKLAIFFSLCTATTIAGTMGDIVQSQHDSYLGVFGGGGTVSSISAAQLGTAYFIESSGGPLAVNAQGDTNAHSEWMIGGQAGHLFSTQAMPHTNSWFITPAAEIEGFYIGRNTVTGYDLHNETTRLDEHDFLVSYPMSAGVGLVNALINFNHTNHTRWHPYIAGGIGAAVVSINNANSLQTAPLEPNINHYNTDPSDSSAVFASQAKAGLHVDLTEHFGVFAEYRYIYLSTAHFEFGSTAYPNHAETSNWSVTLGTQSYNMGVAGLRYTI